MGGQIFSGVPLYAEDIEVPFLVRGSQEGEIIKSMVEIGNSLYADLRENYGWNTRTHVDDLFLDFHKRVNNHIKSHQTESIWCQRVSDPESCSVFTEELDAYAATISLDALSHAYQRTNEVTIGISSFLDEEITLVTSETVTSWLVGIIREQVNIVLTEMGKQKDAYREISNENRYADGDPNNSAFDIVGNIATIEDLFVWYSPFLDEDNELYDEDYADIFWEFGGFSFSWYEDEIGIWGLFSFERGGYPGGWKQHVFDLAKWLTKMLESSDSEACGIVTCEGESRKIKVIENVVEDANRTANWQVIEVDHNSWEITDYWTNERDYEPHLWRWEEADSEISGMPGAFIEKSLEEIHGKPSVEMCWEIMCIDVQVRKTRHSMSIKIQTGSEYTLRDEGYSDDFLGIFQRWVDFFSQIAKSDLACKQRPPIQHFQMEKSNKWDFNISWLQIYIYLKSPPFLRQYVGKKLLPTIDLLALEGILEWEETWSDGASSEESEDWELSAEEVRYIDGLYKAHWLDFTTATFGNEIFDTTKAYLFDIRKWNRWDGTVYESTVINDNRYRDEIEKRQLEQSFVIRENQPAITRDLRLKDLRQNISSLGEAMDNLLAPLELINDQTGCVSF